MISIVYSRLITNYALHDDCGQKRLNARQRSSLLDGNINDVVEQTVKIILLANCCVGEAEPAGQTAMERRWRRSNVK